MAVIIFSIKREVYFLSNIFFRLFFVPSLIFFIVINNITPVMRFSSAIKTIVENIPKVRIKRNSINNILSAPPKLYNIYRFKIFYFGCILFVVIYISCV